MHDSIAAIPIVLFILLCVGVMIADSRKQRKEEPTDYSNRGHQAGCPWCGHFVQCERLDCPIKR